MVWFYVQGFQTFVQLDLIYLIWYIYYFQLKTLFIINDLLVSDGKIFCFIIKFVYKFTFDAKVFTPDVSLYTKNMQSLFSNDE